MKHQSLHLLLILLCISTAGCRKDNPAGTYQPPAEKHSLQPAPPPPDNSNESGRSGGFVHYTDANELIQSYLKSIDTFIIPQVRAFYLNADDLRTYLADAAITELKIFLAHTGSIVHSGLRDKYSGLNADALTLVIAGVDTGQNYVLHQKTAVINRISGCPSNCIVAGSAANDLITADP